MYKDFQSLKDAMFNAKFQRKRIIIAGALDEHALEAAFLAQREGYVTPVLVGNEEKVKVLIDKLGFKEEPYTIVHCDGETNPSTVAVKLIHENKGDFILKGKMETKDLLRPILDKTTGLNGRGFITHFGLVQIHGYHKLLAISDSAVIPYPTLEEKINILNTGIETLRKLGYENPIAGALCAVETISPKMQETIDADKLQNMGKEGFFGKAVVIGPISYDLATRKEAGVIKGYDSPYIGDVDMLLVPNMVTGNVMSKIWNSDDQNILAGCIVGADIPIALTSRSASMNEKLNSILLCCLLCN